MSELPGNPHFEEGNYHNGGEHYALSQATMALAYEQRTANLIALWSLPEELSAALASAAGKDGDGVDKDIYAGVADQLIGRLGL